MVSVLLMQAVEEEKSGGEFVTRLVSPDELPRLTPPGPAFPRMKAAPKRSAPAAVPPPAERVSPAPGTEGQVKEVQPFPEGGEELVPRGASVPGSPAGPPGPSVPSPSMKEKLFDRGVINEFAKRIPEKVEKKKTFTFDTSEYRFLIYNRRLKEKIESVWKYPPEEASQGIYGDLVLRFTIRKNGRLGNIELVRTSGHKRLDDAAIQALRAGEPYWPLPDEWGMQTYTIVGHFVYTIYGYHIR